jgi:hypothetical protein
MGLALLTAGANSLFFVLSDKEVRKSHPLEASGLPDSVWATFLWVALPLTPFLISGLLLSRRSEEAKAAGAGVAVALFLWALLFSIVEMAGLVTGFGPIPYALPLAISGLVVLGCSTWIIVSAFRIAHKAGWGLFFLAAGVSLLGIGCAYHLLGGH